MTEMERMLVEISEFVFVDMGGGVKTVKHIVDENDMQTCFVMLTEDGKEYVVEIRAK